MADVHKHALLAWMLDYMTAKPKPMRYLETHGGRALYDLSGPEAAKTGEAARGIGRAERWFPDDHPYARALAAVRAANGPGAYPGSPWIARHLLRETDSATVAELHPAEGAALAASLSGLEVVRGDGFAAVLSRCPPTPRRGLMLCDPSWEVKEDYARMPDFLVKLHAKWPVGVLVLWYPVLLDARHRPMLAALRARLPHATAHEIRFPPARPGHGMVGSGLFVVNPPWGFDAQAAWLSERLATG